MVCVLALDQFIFWPRHSDWHWGENVSWVSPGFLGNDGSSAAQAIMLSGPRGTTQPHVPLVSCTHPSAF